MKEDLYTALSYVMLSRRYANVYIKKEDQGLFSSVRSYIELPYVGGVGTVVTSSRPYGRSKTKSKCYLHWEDHPHKPERNGKPVSSVTIEAVLQNLINNNNAYEL